MLSCGLPHSYRRLFFGDLDALNAGGHSVPYTAGGHSVPYTAGHPAPSPEPPLPEPALPVLRVTQLSPFVTPSHVTF